MKKRLLAGLMAMCLVLTLLPASALAAGPEEDGTKENPWDVSAEGNGNEVYAYLTENNSVEGTYGDTVTLSFGGYTLHIEGTGDTRDFIGENTPPWNDKKTSITAIWIGDGVTSIGSGALSGATSLTTINGNNTKETGYIMFPAQLKNWGTALNKTGLSGELRFPEECQLAVPSYLNIYGNNNITSVDWTNYPLSSIMGHWTQYAYNDDPYHTALTDLGLDTLPNSVTSIGEYAFDHSYVENLTIPNTADITYGTGAFRNSKVKNLTINVSRTGSALAEMMFNGCDQLEDVRFIGNELQKIPGGLFMNAVKLDYLALPYGVTEISTVSGSIATFGIGSSVEKDDVDKFTLILPSSLETVDVFAKDSNTRVGLLSYRYDSKVKVLAPESEIWDATIEVSGKNVPKVVGGLLGEDITYYQSIKDASNFYQYTLATEADVGDTVTVFRVEGPDGETCSELPEGFGTISYDIADASVLSDSLEALSAGETTVEIFITKPGSNVTTKIAETTITVSAASEEEAAETPETSEEEVIETLEKETAETPEKEIAETSQEEPPAETENTAEFDFAGANLPTVGAAPAPLADGDTVTFYNAEGESLGTATQTSGTASLSYNTTQKGIPIGTSEVTVKDSSNQVLGTITVTLNPKALTVTGLRAVDRRYDGSTAVSLTGGTLVGVESGDSVSFTASGRVTDASAGANKPVRVTVSLTGGDAGWYTVTNPTGVTVDITGSSGSSSGSSGSSSSSSASRYDVDVERESHGSVETDSSRARKGERVILTPEPEEGYVLAGLTVTDEDGNEVEVTRRSDGSYLFYMPDGDVTIEAEFVPAEPEAPALPFTDVAEGAWYYDAVAYCWENGIMDGTGGSLFTPGGVVTRAMAAQVLHNLAGSPAGAGSFPDVAAGAWYADAAAWAASSGVVTGYPDGRFGPNDPVTREQLAAMLYRYARAMGLDVTAGGMGAREFADYDQISGWAVEAMTWAVSQGVLTGKDGNRLDPAGFATRAELAQILARFAR